MLLGGLQHASLPQWSRITETMQNSEGTHRNGDDIRLLGDNVYCSCSFSRPQSADCGREKEHVHVQGTAS
jgi:hypothetical protein